MVKGKKNKLLIILRLFTGIETSIINQKWSPTGIPTVFKFIEKADKKFNCRIIFFSYGDNENQIDFSNPKKKIEGLSSEIFIYKNYYKNKFLLGKLISNLISMIRIFFHCLNFRPNKIYLNNQNILFGFILKNIFFYKVIIRIMGVYQPMRDIFKKFSIKNYIMRKIYQSNYDMAILTQDGSGSELWSKYALTKTKKKEVLINGIDKPSKYKTYDKAISNILFFGRLENGKGILEFIEFAIKLENIFPNKYKFIVIGSGEYDSLLNQSFTSNHINYQHYKMIPHRSINQILNYADIYISLNKRGSLSNANLEVFKKGVLSIILSSDHNNKIDIFTDDFLTDDAVIRIDRNDIINQLLFLFTNINLNKKAKKYSKRLIEIMNLETSSWDERIEYEINEIEKI